MEIDLLAKALRPIQLTGHNSQKRSMYDLPLPALSHGFIVL